MVSLRAVALFSTVLGGWAFELPGLLSVLKRQDVEPGTPLYDCHASCGYAIVISQETTSYCSNSTFTSDLSSCLECALTYDIWQYYGDDVASAADACGDDATPSSSSVTAGASATGNATVVSSTALSTATTSAAAASGSQTAATATGSTASATSSTTTAQSTGAASSLTTNSMRTLLVAIGILAVM